MRGKERSRKTMEQLKRSKQVKQADDTSPTKRTGLMGTMAGTMNTAFVEGSPIDILLFGPRSKANSYATSFGQTGSSGSESSTAQVVAGLKNMIKVQDITTFAISTVAADGSRLYTLEKIKAMGGNGKVSIETQLSTKIQVLLDQRKPPTEVLPSLVDQYDDELNPL